MLIGLNHLTVTIIYIDHGDTFLDVSNAMRGFITLNEIDLLLSFLRKFSEDCSVKKSA